MATELQRLRKWVNMTKTNDPPVVHFYIDKKSKVNDPIEYFIFNIHSNDRCWQIRGTIGHGKKCSGKESKIPILNCWKMNSNFFKGLRKYYQDKEKYGCYKYAVILSLRKLREYYRDKVVDVKPYYGEKIKPSNGWHYDVKSFKWSLGCFRDCDVVRVQISKDPILGEPIVRLSPKMVLGIMVPRGEKVNYYTLLKRKGLSHVQIFYL